MRHRTLLAHPLIGSKHFFRRSPAVLRILIWGLPEPSALMRRSTLTMEQKTNHRNGFLFQQLLKFIDDVKRIYAPSG